MVVVAGEGRVPLSDFYLLNLETMNWIKPKLSFENWESFPPRRFHTATAVDPELFWSGSDNLSEGGFDPEKR